jgi:hypothetical protein
LRPCKVENPKHIESFGKMFQKGDVDYSILKEMEKYSIEAIMEMDVVGASQSLK